MVQAGRRRPVIERQEEMVYACDITGQADRPEGGNEVALQRSEIKDVIKGMTKGSTIPAMLGRILSIVRDEHSFAGELCDLIRFDQGLAGMVLRVANSPMFGRSGQISNIEQAVMYLGYEQIKSIAMGMSILSVFPARKSFSIKKLWAHGYEVASIATAVSERVPATSQKECFLAGLLHDIGRMVLYSVDHVRFLSVGTDDDMLERERELFSCTHEEAGAWYLQYAGLPEEIVLPVKYHHRPSKSTGYRDATSIVALAEGFSRRFYPKIEDDGIWGAEHSAIMLEMELTEEDMVGLAGILGGMKYEIESFFGG